MTCSRLSWLDAKGLLDAVFQPFAPSANFNALLEGQLWSLHQPFCLNGVAKVWQFVHEKGFLPGNCKIHGIVQLTSQATKIGRLINRVIGLLH